jgi:hypothetical protein
MTLEGHVLALQWDQLRHDELYHREIVRLPVGDRIKHFALHMAKYAGNFADAIDSSDNFLFERALTDALIITLASANALRIDLGRAFAHLASDSIDDLQTLGLELAKQSGARERDLTTFLKQFARHTGRLAKACESLDHVESHAFREAMSGALVDLFRVLLAEGSALQLDLVARVKERLRGIESKDIFHRFYL